MELKFVINFVSLHNEVNKNTSPPLLLLAEAEEHGDHQTRESVRRERPGTQRAQEGGGVTTTLPLSATGRGVAMGVVLAIGVD